jgi:hypothetical protein
MANFLTKVKDAWKFVSDKEKVQTFVTKMYAVVAKLLNVLKVLKEYVSDPKFASQIPAVISALSTVLSVFVKLAPLLGIDLPMQAPAKKGLTLEEAKKDLESCVSDLDEVLKASGFKK